MCPPSRRLTTCAYQVTGRPPLGFGISAPASRALRAIPFTVCVQQSVSIGGQLIAGEQRNGIKARSPVEQLELRRHARRDPHADALTAEGRAMAATSAAPPLQLRPAPVSPAGRAAETAAWFLRGAMQQLPDHAVVPGLGGHDASGGSPEGMAAGVLALLDQLPEGGTGLAISHTPLVEPAVGLTGAEVAPFRECEGNPRAPRRRWSRSRSRSCARRTPRAGP